MAFCSINCMFDMDLFDLCLTYALNNEILCLLVSNPPMNHYNATVYKDAIRKMEFYQENGFFLFFKKPATFELLISCSVDVVFGVLTLPGHVYGLIVFSHYDFIGDSTKILDMDLPMVLSCLVSLFVGGADMEGNPVHMCDEVVILGSISRRNYPAPEGFVWPDFSNLLPATFPRRLFVSKLYRATSLFLPVLYDWRLTDLYLPYKGAVDQKTLRSHVSDVTNRLGGLISLDPCLSWEKQIADCVESANLFDFLRSPYETKCYSKWKEDRNSSADSSPNDMFFCMSWIQHLSVNRNTMLVFDNCAHTVLGPRYRIYSPETCGNYSSKTSSSIPYSVLKGLPFGQISRDIPATMPVIAEYTFSGFYEYCSQLFMSCLPPSQLTKSDYIVVRRCLNQFIPRAGPVCRLLFTDNNKVLTRHGCVFGMPHEIEFVGVRNFSDHSESDDSKSDDSKSDDSKFDDSESDNPIGISTSVDSIET